MVKLIWMIFLITELRATITQGPSNSVAEIGGQVKLNCVATNPIGYWVWSKNGTATDEVTLAGPGCSIRPAFVDHYAVESLGGGTTCNLIVFNITMAQAGVYRCLESPSEFLSILTVIDSFPAIYLNSSTTVVENESVIIECVLNHNGSVPPAPTLRPYFYWTDFNALNVSSSYDSTTENTAVSKITVTAGPQDIMPFTCHVYFQLIPPTNPNYAGNIPTVNKSASSPTIEVISLQTSSTPSMVSTTSPSTTTTVIMSCTYQPVAPSSDGITIAMGVLFGISLTVNIAILIIWIYNRLRSQQDPIKKPENVLRPEMRDLSNGTSGPSTYEELKRPDESQFHQDTYQELTPTDVVRGVGVTIR